MKLLRIPAMAGGAMIGGMAYLQYQAARKNAPCFVDIYAHTVCRGR